VLESDRALHGYAQARQVSLNAWLSSLADGQRSSQLLLFSGAAEPPAGWQRIARCVTLLASSELAGNFILPASPGLCCVLAAKSRNPAADVVVVVQRALERDARFFDFDGLETCPGDALTWLKQAIRYARRV
jgi:hypothetical protein